MTKVSVAICTYNGQKYIAEQLQSILRQTRLPDEIVICDDNSTDRTVEIIQSTFKEHSFEKFKIEINKPGLRTIKNFEKAISLCSGKWIFLSDQDDIWNNNKIETMLKALRWNTLLLFSNGRLIDQDGNDLHATLWEHWGFTEEQQKRWNNNPSAFKDLLINKNFVTGATVLLNRKILKKALPILVPNAYYHDAWFALHAAASDGLHFIRDCTINYRIHSEQQVGISRKGNDMSSVFSDDNISNEAFKQKIQKQYYNSTLQRKIKTLKRILFRK
jgi:glycosyltransferase involved in cell wall biosynthesis